MAQLYDKSVLEISVDKDMNTSFVPESNLSKGNPLNVLLQVAGLPEELMETKMLVGPLSQPDPKLEPNTGYSIR